MSRSYNNGKEYRKGKLCPICAKSKMEFCDCKGCKKANHRSFTCKRCGWYSI